MTDDSQIAELVEEILDTNCTPEQACRECPELLPAVRRLLEQVRLVASHVEGVFPSRDDSRDSKLQVLRAAGRAPPEIPGYQIEEMIGSGGMGIVYKARHLKLKRIVAIKMMLAGGYAGTRDIERFKREAEAIAALRHQNIVHIYDYGEHEGVPFFTMEFMDRGSLAQALGGAPQSATRAVEVASILANAIEVAHTHDIVHRDLKPANILVASDGTLKISDFGLARRLDRSEEASITLAGAHVGTPSYMSPEQALGTKLAIGPCVDIYAIGAILYEMLTGRPPFRAESASDTERQVVNDDPVPPTRLNPRVPRDLQTICLKCLEKDPARRYASAAELGDDLKRFEEGRPIHARPVGRVERLWRWGRRNPAAAVLLATAVGLAGLASVGGAWLIRQRANLRVETNRQTVESREVIHSALAQAERLRNGFQFREAKAALERAKGPLKDGWQLLSPEARDELHRQMKQAGVDIDLAERLDTARLQALSIVEGSVDTSKAEALYASAFEEAGLGRSVEDVGVVVAAVRASNIRAELVAALDDWASITPDATRREWLLEVARRADPDPVKDALRQPALWQNGEMLERLMKDSHTAEVTPELATALARVARAQNRNALPMLLAAQARFPLDFGINYELACALCDDGQRAEGLGYFRAALVIRPTAVAHNAVGVTLAQLKRSEEAIASFQRAIQLDPTYAVAHYGIGNALVKAGRADEAVDELLQALKLEPELAAAHTSLGVALCSSGRFDDALSHFQQAVRIEPNSVEAHNGLGFALHATGDLEGAVRAYQEALHINPQFAEAHLNLGYSLHSKGQVDEAIALYRDALRIDPKLEMAHHNLGGALIAKGLFSEAIDQYQLALDLNPNLAPAHANMGFALRAMGRLDESIVQYTEAIRLNPKDGAAHINLAKNLRDKGRLDEAVDHVLQAGRIDPKLAIHQDKFSDELYSNGCARIQQVGDAEAPANPDNEREQTELRRQALELLRASLRIIIEVQRDRTEAAQPLSSWEADPALARVRDTAELAKLDDGEREQWQRFWADVAARVAHEVPQE